MAADDDEPTLKLTPYQHPRLPSGLVCALCYWFEGPQGSVAITVMHGYALCVKHVSYVRPAGAWEAAIDLHYADLREKEGTS